MCGPVIKEVNGDRKRAGTQNDGRSGLSCQGQLDSLTGLRFGQGLNLTIVCRGVCLTKREMRSDVKIFFSHASSHLFIIAMPQSHLFSCGTDIHGRAAARRARALVFDHLPLTNMLTPFLKMQFSLRTPFWFDAYFNYVWLVFL